MQSILFERSLYSHYTILKNTSYSILVNDLELRLLSSYPIINAPKEGMFQLFDTGKRLAGKESITLNPIFPLTTWALDTKILNTTLMYALTLHTGGYGRFYKSAKYQLFDTGKRFDLSFITTIFQ
jgi:hypothetical protein